MLPIRLLILCVLLGNVAEASILDALQDGRVFAAHTPNVVFDGSFPEVTSLETIWADSILSGIDPNRFEYFLVRQSGDPSKYSFDFVFFGPSGRAVFVSIPSSCLRRLSDTELSFEFNLRGGGEAGNIETSRTISLILDSNGKLLGQIAEHSHYSRILRPNADTTGTARFEFASVTLPSDAVGRALGCKNRAGKEPSQSKDRTP